MPLHSGSCHLGTKFLDLLVCRAQRISQHFQLLLLLLLLLLLCNDVLLLLLKCIGCLGCDSWLLLNLQAGSFQKVVPGKPNMSQTPLNFPGSVFANLCAYFPEHTGEMHCFQ